jgi:hypothetical protein
MSKRHAGSLELNGRRDRFSHSREKEPSYTRPAAARQPASEVFSRSQCADCGEYAIPCRCCLECGHLACVCSEAHCRTVERVNAEAHEAPSWLEESGAMS